MRPERSGPIGDVDSTSIAVYVCTFRRNGQLRALLTSLQDAAERVQPAVEVAVVVVDDNEDGRARRVVTAFDHRFSRGLHYRHSGSRNISIARNVGLETGRLLADWVAMTDDDQTVDEGWLEALIDVQRATNADAVTGPVFLRAIGGGPSWLTEQPFSDVFEARPATDHGPVDVCLTGNSLISSGFLARHPEIRFRPDLGRTGGEDMVFYRAAVAAGLNARYSTNAICYHELPPERLTYRYFVRTAFWLGNTDSVTNLESRQASRRRLLARSAKKCSIAIARPISRVATRRAAQWRFAGVVLAQSLGILAGTAGVRVRHE